jgi:hypothetical protein
VPLLLLPLLPLLPLKPIAHEARRGMDPRQRLVVQHIAACLYSSGAGQIFFWSKFTLPKIQARAFDIKAH